MINLTTLSYPMFHTTPEEKEILRKCELYYSEICAATATPQGLCIVTYSVCKMYELRVRDCTQFTAKIRQSLGEESYLHWYLSTQNRLFHKWFNTLEGQNLVTLKNNLRRIWITKLLAYEGE